MRELVVTVSAGPNEGKTSLALTILDLLKRSRIGREVTLEAIDQSGLMRKLEKAKYALEDAKITIRSETWGHHPAARETWR